VHAASDSAARQAVAAVAAAFTIRPSTAARTAGPVVVETVFHTP
jgi:hypothetical protein